MLFHGDQACPHAKNGKPCSSHTDKSSSDEFGTCAVVLFGESSEHFFTLSNTSSTVLVDLGVSNLVSNKKLSLERDNDHWARGPPGLI